MMDLIVRRRVLSGGSYWDVGQWVEGEWDWESFGVGETAEEAIKYARRSADDKDVRIQFESDHPAGAWEQIPLALGGP